MSNNVKGDVSNVIGVTNAHRIINDAINDWTDKCMVSNEVNNKNEAMNRDQKWAVGEIVVGVINKRVEFLLENNQ